MSILKKYLEDLKNKRKSFDDKCKAEEGSERFIKAQKHTKSLIFEHYIPTVHEVSFATTRGKHIYDQFLSIRFLDNYLESIVGIYFLAEQGLHNLAKREMRFLLESVLKHWYVDQIMMDSTFEDKIAKYDEIVPRSSIDFAEKIHHYVLKDNIVFNASVQGLYKELCAYTHASLKQMNTKIKRAEKGEYLGFTSAQEIEEVNRLIFRTLEICVICHFNACGPSTTGDLFIQIYDHDPKWKFHQSKFIKEVSDSYNYKHERKSKLEKENKDEV